MQSFKRSYYAGIFLVAAATLLLEVSLTKVFSVIHYHYFAFLIVSTALFGYGFSGILLSVSKRLETVRRDRFLFVSALLFSLTLVASYTAILSIPLRISAIFSDTTQMMYVGLVYLLLSIPFFFSGLVIGVLLSSYPARINRLYFADLTGAGIGCFAVVLLIPYLGGSGSVLAAALLAAAAVFAFAPSRKWIPLPAACMLIIGWLTPQADIVFPTTLKTEKRYFEDSLRNGKHEYTGWSPASRIDVVRIGHDLSVIWIDGGTNQSFMRAGSYFAENFGTRNPDDPVWKTVEIPFAFVRNPRVMIIGPGGGVEVASALSYQPAAIIAVELDPVITQIVTGRFSEFIGHIYRRPGVTLINEEGRSYIRRSKEQYDIIQQKNNSHPMAVASGALNLSETYLLTKEAFHDYIDHLAPNGFLSIERHGGLRMLNLAVEVWRERGVEDYWKRLVLIASSEFNQVFLLKNGAFTDHELTYIHEYAKGTRDKVLYSPWLRDREKNVFAALMREETRREVLDDAPFRLQAPTDDRPFFEHFFRMKTVFSEAEQEKLNHRYWKEAALEGFITGDVIHSDLSLYAILGEAILLSGVFILLPLWKRKRAGIATRGTAELLIYFFCLGLGFIFIEIALIQKYILFIGYPVYTVAAIIFALLIAAGAGSYYTSRHVERPFQILRTATVAIVLLTVAQVLVVPFLFRQFLAAPFMARLVLSILFLLPSGFFMGMPFPIGLSWVSQRHEGFAPWAWGMNGYATVIGSVLSVILALQFGFRFVLLIAAAIYILAYLALKHAAILTEENAEIAEPK